MGKFLRHAASVGGLTLVSRILGVIRDAVIGSVFGTSPAADAFFLAFRPFDLLRKLFSDGILSLSLVPVFSRYLALGQRGQALAMFRSALLIVTAGGGLLVLAGMYFSPVLVDFLAPGWGRGSDIHNQAAQLLTVMMPYLLLVMVLALSMGILNSLGQFAGPAATPVLLNVSIILSVLCFPPAPGMLAFGVIAGGVAQLLFQMPFLLSEGVLRFRDVFRSPGIHPGVVQAGKRFFPYMLGASAFQINTLVAALLASTLEEGSVSCLYFAERLVQFPLALVASSVATVVLPALSKACLGKGNGRDPLVCDGILITLFISIAATAGLMALDRPIVSLLFGRGVFGAPAVVRTAGVLSCLVGGLWAVAGTRIYVTRHFAAMDTRLPVIAGMVSITINFGLGFLLKERWGVQGLALAASLGAVAGFVWISVLSRFGPPARTLWVSACRALFVSGIMFILVREAADVMIPAGMPFHLQAGMLVLLIGFGIISFWAVAALAAKPEMAILKRVLNVQN